MTSAIPSLEQASRSAFPLPTVAEDTLIYAVHLPKTSTSTSSTSSSGVYEDAAAFATLVTSFVDSILGSTWLWNKDGWELKPAEQERKLEGRMRVGDAVDDEWLVVWLLREVSMKWPEVIISIRDTDGEFLLIEAANELPKWVTPTNAENRLWLFDSHLHLLPLEIRSPLSTRPQKAKFDGDEEDNDYPEDLEGWVNEKDALRFTRSGQYRAPKEVEEAVWSRIACYPDAMSTHHQLTYAYLPEPIAKALALKPDLVQKAVEGFYTRDPAQIRAASRLTHFPASPAVLSPVTMTRAAYAQLQGQVMHPSKAFGPEWHVKAPDGPDKQEAFEKEKRWRDLGVKITIGFEIMYKEGGKRERAGKPQASAEDREADSEYQAFIDRLSRLDFFGSETKGSQGWRLKEAEAAKGWQSIKSSDSAQRPSFASQVDAAISVAANVPRETYEVTPLNKEDSEDWLTVDPDELDGMLMRASGRDRAEKSTEATTRPMDLDDSHAQALSNLAAKVGKFVEGEGDIEGARFEDELSDEEMPMDGEDDSEDEDDDMTAQEKDERMRNLVPQLPASEWGRKAAPAEAPSSASKPAKDTKRKEASPPTMRAPLLPRDEFDGHIEESDDESDDEEPKAPAGSMGRIIGDMAWGGPDEETKAARIEDVTEEDEARQAAEAKRSVRWDDDVPVAGGEDEDQEDEEMDPDMQKEEEEFLKFTREQLGITDDMWQGIMADRQARGAFIPETVKNPTSTKLPKITQPDPSVQKHKLESLRSSNVSSERFGSVAPATPFAPSSREPRIENGLNMDLDSFDKVMEAMDDELVKAKKSTAKDAKSKSGGPSLAEAIAQDRKKSTSTSANPLPPLPTEADLEALDEDELMEMDRELRAALKNAGIEDSDDDMDSEFDPEEAKELQGDAREQYKMMRDFLESYKSQGGESGVVGNLFGRLGESSS